MKNFLFSVKALSISVLLFLAGSVPTMAIPWSAEHWQQANKNYENQISLNKIFTGNFDFNRSASFFLNPNDETTLFEEGFEGAGIPAGWTVINTHSNPDSNWHITNMTSSQGSQAMELGYTNPDMMDEWLISPSMDFSAYSGQNIKLSFDFFMSYLWMVTNDGADFMIKASTDDGASWTQLWQEEDYGTYSTFTWTPAFVSLDAYAGEPNVKIAFHYLGDDGAQTILDNIVIQATDDEEPETGCFGDDFSTLTNGGNTSTSGENGPASTEWAGNENFTVVSKAYEAGGAVKLGTGSLSGFIQSKELTDVSGDIDVEISVKGWTAVEGDLIVSIDGQEETLSYTATMADAFEHLSTSFTGVTAGAVLKIETSAKRAFIDDVKIICGEAPPAAGCLFDSGYGTAGAPDACMTTATFTTCNYAGEYTTMTSAVAGNQYSFQSSIATDYLTIREGTPDGAVIGYGMTPVTVTATAGGNIYIHISADEDCSPQSSCRTTSVSCASCAPLEDYCIVSSTNVNYGIGNFTTSGGVDNIDNTTGSGTYTDYSDQFVSQYAGDSVDFSISGAGSEGQTYGYAVWVDWNNDYCFLNEGEAVYNSAAYIQMAEGQIVVPEGTAPGDYRMRVVNNWLTQNPTPCGSLGSASYGEAEDYTFRVLETETPSNEDCDQGDDSNGFENGLQVGAGTDFRNADDFFVSAGNTLHIVQIELNAIYMYDSVGSVDLIFYKDEGGVPGAVEQTVSGLIPSAQPAIGTAFGYSVKTLFIDVDLSFTEGHYWMQPTLYDANGGTGGFFWEVTTAGTLGEPIVTSEQNGPWTYDEEGSNAVFKLHCEAVTPPEEPCLFAITSSIEPITRVILSDIDNSSDPNSSIELEDFTSIVGHIAPGASYDVALEGNTDGPYTNYFTLWIDFDQNGSYESSEMFEIGSITSSTGTDGQQATANITIPASAVTGNTTMRVIKSYGSSPTNPCGAYSFGQGEDYSIIIGELEGCNGTPEGGSVSVNPAVGNPGSTYTVSANGYTVGIGLTYQWQSNTDDAGWVNEGDAADAYSAYTAIAPDEVGIEVEWRLEVSCTNSGETAYSTSDTFTTEVVYCQPTFLFAEPITRVVFSDIDNSSSPDSSEEYEDFTSVVGNVTLTETYDIALEGNTSGDWENFFTVWVDWNQNGTFEATEMYEIGSIFNSTGTDGQQATGTISVPADALIGETRMRVIKNYDESPTDPCGSYFFGQTEDYTLNVESLGVNDMGLADFAYWPNPVKDVLNISSDKAVQSVDVFNLAGQSVMMNAKVTNGKVDVSALTQGTYIFRIKFDGNKAKSFKVIKR